MLRPKSLAALTVATTMLCSAQALATGVQEASAKGKGITGGALLGAEVVVLTEAAIGVKPYWAYGVGAAAGAVAGGVGGYFLEDAISAKSNMLLLSGGMVLVIPTLIAMLSATAYEPPTNYVQDQGPTDEPIADPPDVEADEPVSRQSPVQRRRMVSRTKVVPNNPSATSLVDLSDSGVSLRVPALAAVSSYSDRELTLYGVRQQTELRLPVFNWVF